MGSIKEKIYDYLVRKNENVRYEYERYVMEHVNEHYENRLKHWGILISLKWHYQVMKSDKPMLYQNKLIENNVKKEEKLNQINTGDPYVSDIHKQSAAPVKKEKKEQNGKSPIQVNQASCIDSDEREPVLSFVSNLLRYDIISFDVFDTLIFRPFSNPRDLFYIVGKKLNILNFRQIRVDAEDAVRKEAKLKYGNHEVDLRKIYLRIEHETGINAEVGMKTEIDTETELCYANPYMLRVFRLLKSQGKKIIAVSDMYLPAEIIMNILEKCGYEGFDDVFISCEYMCNKRNGGLYKTVKKVYGDNCRFIHIGDNFESDIESARRNGLTAKYYKNVNEIGKGHRALGMSDLIGSAYSGIVNAWLYSGINKYSAPYEYGFVYGGIYILGYCNWIHKKVQKEGIDKIIFLSRDGEIYKKIYNMMFPEEKNTEYLYWSRIANVKTTVESMRANFLSSTIKNKAADEMNITAGALLKSLDLDSLCRYLRNYHLKPDTVIIRENYLVLEEMLIDHWDDVISAYEPYETATRKILENVIGSAEKIAVVDVGWTGTGPMGIKGLVEDKWQLPVKIYCYVAASRVWGHVSNIAQITDEIVEPYIFSRQYNRNLYDTHVKTNNNTNNIYFEFFTQAAYPSFGGYCIKNNEIKYLFDIPEVENYETIKEIHNGITDFCIEYMKRFENEKWMLNISGYDAYVPYRHAILNMNFIKRTFGDFKFARGISSDVSDQRLESMKDIWRKTKL